MIPVVLSDLHSRKKKVIEVLRLAGVLNYDGERNPGYQLIQVGDAVSAGYGMAEAEFYRWWTGLLEEQDVELVGNHEAPILWPYDDRFKFYGYMPGDMGESGCDKELIPEVLARKASYKAAHVVNGWLITHAGVMKRYQRDSAEDTAEHLNTLWSKHMDTYDPHPWHSCPICCNQTGIMWVRDLEKTALDPTPIKQIFGHTPDGPTRSKGGTMWNIDTPRIGSGFPNRKVAEEFGGVCALVWREHYAEWEPLYVR